MVDNPTSTPADAFHINTQKHFACKMAEQTEKPNQRLTTIHYPLARPPLRAAHIGAVLGRDLDLLAFLYEERNLNDLARLERGRLLHIVRAIATHALGALGD